MNGKKAKAKEFFDQFLLQALAEFVALAAVISFLGMCVYDKMDILLIDSLKEAVAQQSQSTAYALEKRFQHKLDELDTSSSYAEDEEYAFFFHSTYISKQDHLMLAGYVEWDDVVVGIDYIYTLMKMVFYVLLILLYVLVGYHMRTQQLKHSEHQTAMSIAANKAKSDFLSRMSHEIRTPINAVMGMDEMILRESKEPATLAF